MATQTADDRQSNTALILPTLRARFRISQRALSGASIEIPKRGTLSYCRAKANPQLLTARQRGDIVQHTGGDRLTSIELLRIVSMLMIVFHHFAVHGGFDWDGSKITVPRLW